MKKIIGTVLILTTILLFKTKSMYVEWDEIFIIVASISAISLVYNLFLKANKKYSKILFSSALMGFLLSNIFYLLDLVVDHYWVIQGVPDGRFLTLGETFSEFSDDLFLLSIIAMCSVTLISFVGTTIYSKLFRKASQ